MGRRTEEDIWARRSFDGVRPGWEAAPVLPAGSTCFIAYLFWLGPLHAAAGCPRFREPPNHRRCFITCWTLATRRSEPYSGFFIRSQGAPGQDLSWITQPKNVQEGDIKSYLENITSAVCLRDEKICTSEWHVSAIEVWIRIEGAVGSHWEQKNVGANMEEIIGSCIRFSRRLHEYRWLFENGARREGSLKHLY